MATYNGATFKTSSNGDRLDAVHDHFKAVSKQGRLSRFGGWIVGLVRGFFTELGRLLKVAMFAGAVGAAAGFGLIMLGYSDPVLGAKHFASAPHCAFAEYLGVDHARMQEPGYWRHHDADLNGVACE